MNFSKEIRAYYVNIVNQEVLLLESESFSIVIV